MTGEMACEIQPLGMAMGPFPDENLDLVDQPVPHGVSTGAWVTLIGGGAGGLHGVAAINYTRAGGGAGAYLRVFVPIEEFGETYSITRGLGGAGQHSGLPSVFTTGDVSLSAGGGVTGGAGGACSVVGVPTEGAALLSGAAAGASSGSEAPAGGGTGGSSWGSGALNPGSAGGSSASRPGGAGGRPGVPAVTPAAAEAEGGGGGGGGYGAGVYGGTAQPGAAGGKWGAGGGAGGSSWDGPAGAGGAGADGYTLVVWA